ncbi:GTPase HflX [Candidatus Palauibacter sp.]|uniref:GTPase HflX n=1 Tax=Candidatus Palauibacter sp. TaxID=3101350 RepID=UPI003AF1FE7E
MTSDGTGERAVLVGAPSIGTPQEAVDEHLEELTRLAGTAGADVRSVVIQRLGRPNASTYIGKGKVEQLAGALRDHDATLAIFDDELTPAQGANLESALGVRALDRTELILDIFALRARTAEAKLQVELAQLQYLRTRLKRMWTHLSREGGGIGARGPGEQQIETDRRLIDRRLARLRRKLDHIATARVTQRRARREQFTVALVGYTNAGKSSILRGLSGAEVFVEDRLFATVDSATRICDLEGPGPILLTDTVGFIRKLPHHLIASFRATMEEISEAGLLLHVIDASAPGWEAQRDAVEAVLEEVGVTDRPVLQVFNKIDRLTHEEERALRERTAAGMRSHVLTSVVEERGLDPLREALKAAMRARLETVRVSLPAGDGARLAEAYREGEVLECAYEAGHVVILARVPAGVAGRWRESGLVVEQADAA